MADRIVEVTMRGAVNKELQIRMVSEALRALRQAFSSMPLFLQEHSIRVGLLGQVLLMEAQSQNEKLNSAICEQYVQDAFFALLWHDIGKVSVCREILDKPAKLNLVERRLLLRHPEIGRGFLKDVFGTLAGNVFPQVLMEMMLNACSAHHERWDGMGYPYRLWGDFIPYIGRVTAIADSFDAMYAKRPYHSGKGLKRIADEIEKCAGTQFDPGLVGVFTSCTEQFDAIERQPAKQLHKKLSTELAQVVLRFTGDGSGMLAHLSASTTEAKEPFSCSKHSSRDGLSL